MAVSSDGPFTQNVKHLSCSASLNKLLQSVQERDWNLESPSDEFGALQDAGSAQHILLQMVICLQVLGINPSPPF